MSNRPKVSVIIPVYNAEKYLDQCITSLLCQTLSDCEYIFVNDGSVDNSKDIIENYQKQESRIKIINQENQGVSAARNAGITTAQGEYIGFVDADDYVSADYFERFMKYSGSDMVAINPTDLSIPNNAPISTAQLYLHMLASDSFNSVCFKIFKRNIVVKNKVSFPVGVRLGEDAHFILNFLKHTVSVSFLLDGQGYFYRENIESATKAPVRDNSVFDRVFSEFKFEHQKQYDIQLSDEEIITAKLEKLWHTYLASLSIYFRVNTAIDKVQRYQYIKKSMMEFCVIYTQTINHDFWQRTRSNFEQFVLSALIKKQFWKLKMAYGYSHYRNNIE